MYLLNILRQVVIFSQRERILVEGVGATPAQYLLTEVLERIFAFLSLLTGLITFGILIKKLIAKGVREEILNVIIKLYNCSFVSTDLITIINVKSGVGQAKLCSPLEYSSTTCLTY